MNQSLSLFNNLGLPGGFVIDGIELISETLLDPIGREAVAQTSIVARRLKIRIRAGMSNEELSITLYHEVLEAATVASRNPPASVIDLNEAGFEEAARTAHATLGAASPDNLGRMLTGFGFEE